MAQEGEKIRKYGISPGTILLIGMLAGGALIFGYFESNFMNTYIDHVLGLSPLHISLMVSLSALMGLTFLLVWGVISDNTRSKYGRRRPFLLFGIVMGTGMILYSFSPNYLWCVIIDVVILGLCSNAYYAGQRALVPDLVKLEHRGRVNGVVNVIASLGLIIGISMTLIANEFFTIPRGDGNIVNQEGHIFLLSFGGIFLIICGFLGFLFIQERNISDLPPKKKFIEELRNTFNLEDLKEQKEFFKLILALTVFKTGLGVIMPFLFNFIFSLGLETIELVFVLGIAAPALFAVILVLGKLTDTYGRKKFLTPLIFISSIGFFMLPFIAEASTRNIPLLILTISLVLVGALALLVPLDTWSQDLLPPDRRGQFLGILNIINTVSQMVGAIIGGLVATAIIGVAISPLGWLFAVVPIFLIASIPLFMRVKETLA